MFILIQNQIDSFAKHIMNTLQYFFPNNTKPLKKHLIRACETGNLELVKRYYSLGMSLTDKKFYKDPTIVSCICGQIDIVKYAILQGVNIRARGDLAIRLAAENGHLELVKYLVSQGANIHCRDEFPLRISLERQYFELAQYIVSLCPDLTCIDYYVISHVICYHDNIKILKYIVSLGIEINIHDYFGSLNIAVGKGNFETLKYFVDAGMSVCENEDMIYHVCTNGHLNILKYLIDKGLKISIDDDCAIKITAKYSMTCFVYLSQFYSIKDIELFSVNYREQQSLFYDLLHKFYYDSKWIVNKENIKTNRLWDSNIGLIVASYCW